MPAVREMGGNRRRAAKTMNKAATATALRLPKSSAKLAPVSKCVAAGFNAAARLTL
jgi:hypothetical protein